jgi:hypothetical protein
VNPADNRTFGGILHLIPRFITLEPP